MRADESPANEKGQPGLVSAALSGLCPRCGRPTLFDAPASVAFACSHCELDFRTLERGGRLVGLLTILIAAILISLALLVDILLQPPFLLQALFWGPVTIASVIGGLRFFKTALLYARYDAQHDGEDR